jgi:RNA polymerase sigma-70 factor (ECF subfamily)
MAETARLLQPSPNPDVLDTLAAAYAEAGQFDQAIKTEQEAIKLARDDRREEFRKNLKLYEDHKPRRETLNTNEQPKDKKEGASTSAPKAEAEFAQKRLETGSAAPVKFLLVQNTEPAADKSEVKRPPGLLGYGDDKPDGKKSIGGSGELIQFELPEGVTKIKGIRIHGSRYGLPQAPKEDFEITFLNEKLDETLHSEGAPYRLFNRGKEQWVRVAFKNEVELPRKFWVCLNFNAAQTKGVYVSYDTSTKGEHSRVGLPGDTEKPKETDFKGDWMVQLILAKPEK